MELISEIKNYIFFLKNECSLQVSLHSFTNENVISTTELKFFNIHENPYCICVKKIPGAQKHCIERQRGLFSELQSTESFVNTCYAGVKEYVYPVSDGKEFAGLVFVSGYKSENAVNHYRTLSYKFNCSMADLEKEYKQLKNDMPDKAVVDVMVMPLIRMLELAYMKNEETEKALTLTEKIIQYTNRNYFRDITLEDICTEFSCSRSHISHLFKKETGKSFREFLTDVRLQVAKSLLKNSRLTVTEIAYSVGFSDSNYFSNVFKSKEGVSPGKYRKS